MGFPLHEVAIISPEWMVSHDRLSGISGDASEIPTNHLLDV